MRSSTLGKVLTHSQRCQLLLLSLLLCISPLPLTPLALRAWQPGPLRQLQRTSPSRPCSETRLLLRLGLRGSRQQQ
jgi:hypothetical protein